MGKYNFDEIIDRRGTSCNKWEYNVPEDVVPMWVADMDFAAAPEIREERRSFRCRVRRSRYRRLSQRRNTWQADAG